jgi:IMP dehydrogenase
VRRGFTFDDIALVPQYNNVDSRSDPDLSTLISKDYKINIPIINSPMDTVIGKDLAQVLSDKGTIPIFHRFFQLEDIEKDCDYNYIITCGGRYEDNYGTDIKKSIAWVLSHIDRCQGILIDTAHGHSPVMIDAIKRAKDALPADKQIIAGSVCTAQGYNDLAQAGADAIRVGIGPGAACTTRVVTGFGVPQFTAIQDCAVVAKRLKIPIIADGGIRGSADIIKALAAGASTVMLGKLLALTEESAAEKRGGWVDVGFGEKNTGPIEAKYRGQASADFQNDKYGKVKDGTVAEGTNFWAPVKGSAASVIDTLLAGVRSGLTYGGARTIKELQEKADFIEVTSNYITEANPRVG